MNIYQESLMNHYHNPRNRGYIDNADFTSQQHNPSCGDSICFQGIVLANRLEKLAFLGKGCVISQATASLLSVESAHKTTDEIMAFNTQIILKLVGMELGPVRIKCALLPLQALQEGIQTYLAKQKGPNAPSCQSNQSVTGTST